jgi:spore germination protein YaaH
MWRALVRMQRLSVAVVILAMHADSNAHESPNPASSDDAARRVVAHWMTATQSTETRIATTILKKRFAVQCVVNNSITEYWKAYLRAVGRQIRHDRPRE